MGLFCECYKSLNSVVCNRRDSSRHHLGMYKHMHHGGQRGISNSHHAAAELQQNRLIFPKEGDPFRDRLGSVGTLEK